MPDSPKQPNNATELSVKSQADSSFAIPDIIRPLTTNTVKAELSIVKVPEFKVNTGIDVVTLSSFAITALIVIATTIFTFRSAKNTAKSQEKVATARETNELERLRAEKRADNRQEWINTLRSDLAAYVGAAMNTWNLHQMSASRASFRQSLPSEQLWQESSKWAYEYNLSLRELERLKAKIKLLLNPTESPSIQLADFIDTASSIATSGYSVIAACNSIIYASQPILKNEWEKVKALQ
jgi:hypothetical protein